MSRTVACACRPRSPYRHRSAPRMQPCTGTLRLQPDERLDHGGRGVGSLILRYRTKRPHHARDGI
jgi:hypothetical protein